MQIFKNPNFNFMKYKYTAFLLSFIVIAIGIINIYAGKGLSLGIDFAGGALIQIRFKNPFPIAALRQTLSVAGMSGSKITEVEKEQREFIIRTMLPDEEIEKELEAHEIIGKKVIEILTPEEDRQALQNGLIDINNTDAEELASLLKPAFPEDAREIAEKTIKIRDDPEKQKGVIENFDQISGTGISREAVDILKEKTFLGSQTIKRRETVGPQVGKDLRHKATQATVWALIGMLIYIGIRFKFAYGVSAIITLAHDVLVTLGIFSLTNREVNLSVIAAILTIVGYSLNDTIVIFDRVRDNLKTMRKHEFETTLNASINQTLSRSIITSGTTLLTVGALYIFGGEVINDFAFTMLVGIVAGSYSTIYQSCSLLYLWKKIFKPKKGLGK